MRNNVQTYSNAVQLCLPLDVSICIDKDDPVFSFLDAIEGVNLGKFIKPTRSNNTHSHDRGMLLRVMMFAYMEGHRSLSRIEQLCKTDIRYMYLSNEQRPSKMAFQRMTECLKETIDEVFFEISHHIAVDLMGIDTQVQYVDGTKIEANAHKNSFVYKKRIINAQKNLNIKTREIIHSLNQENGYSYPIKGQYESLDVFYICQYLMEVINENSITIVYGKGQRKTRIQRYYDTLLGLAMKHMEYEYWLDIMQDRNSCSKIDHDATFMATKWDYYNQSGVTRPCYNCQIAVSDGIIVNAKPYQNPGDTMTWQDFMNRYKAYHGVYPKWPVADAGYGSYDNYWFNLTHSIELVQKYSMYGKKEDKKFQKRTFNSLNWKEEDGYKVCPNGRVFNEYEQDRWHYSKTGLLMISQVYKEPSRCEGCPFKAECIRGQSKSIYKNVILEEFQEEVDKNLNSEQGKEFRKQRSVQSEGAFGVIKQNFGFTRFTRRGMKSVNMEFLLVCLGYNFRKYHLYRQKMDTELIH